VGKRGKGKGRGLYFFLHEKEKDNHQFGIVFFFLVHQRIVSAVKRAEFVSDRVSYIVLTGRW
jgi:hypothetical protein